MHGQGLTLHPACWHRARVAADTDGAFTFFIGFVRHVNELGAQGFDLFLYGRTHVGRFDDRAQTFRGSDRLQPRYACAENQHAGGFYRTGGGHQHWHEAWVVMGGE